MSALVEKILREAGAYEDNKIARPTKSNIIDVEIYRLLHDDHDYDPTFDPKALDPVLKETAKFVNVAKEMPSVSKPMKSAVVPPMIPEENSVDENGMPGLVRVYGEDGTVYYVEPHNLKQPLNDSVEM